jgi:cbb3-type cytochrome oxidase subunit 3
MSILKITLAARDHRKLFCLALFLLGGILAAFALQMPARADESRTLIIPPNDGYGFEECLKPGSQCGLVVADAWCKAHGFAGSNGFGPADEAAGAMDEASRSKVEPGSLHVTCGGRLN